jgi:hypothetical protein
MKQKLFDDARDLAMDVLSTAQVQRDKAESVYGYAAKDAKDAKADEYVAIRERAKLAFDAAKAAADAALAAYEAAEAANGRNQ